MCFGTTLKADLSFYIEINKCKEPRFNFAIILQSKQMK